MGGGCGSINHINQTLLHFDANELNLPFKFVKHTKLTHSIKHQLFFLS